MNYAKITEYLEVKALHAQNMPFYDGTPHETAVEDFFLAELDKRWLALSQKERDYVHELEETVADRIVLKLPPIPLHPL